MKQNILAIDIGGSKLMIGLVSPAGRILYKKMYPVPGDINKAKLLDLISTAFTEYKKEAENLTYYAAGVTIPGLTDSKNGIWILAPFSGIADFKIAEKLSDLFAVPVAIENDVNACAIAEHVFGACKQTSDYMWITVSNGCGGSIFANGRLYSGGFSNAGEVGHIIVEEENGLKCGCGNTGCFEAMAAGPGIVKRYCLETGSAANNLLTAENIAELAAQGDKIAQKVYDKTGYYIGKVLATAANLINPRKIVLGGGVVQSMDLFEHQMRKTFDKMVFQQANKDVQIIRTALGQDAALLGAAALPRSAKKKNA